MPRQSSKAKAAAAAETEPKAVETESKAPEPKPAAKKSKRPRIRKPKAPVPVDIPAEKPVAAEQDLAPPAPEPRELVQPEEVVVGRHYHVQHTDAEGKTNRLVGKLVATSGKSQHIQVWRNGRESADVLEVSFAKYDTREVSRESCKDLTQPHV